MTSMEIDIKGLSAEKTRKAEAFSGWKKEGDPCDTLEGFFVPITEDGDAVISQGGAWSKDKVF